MMAEAHPDTTLGSDKDLVPVSSFGKPFSDKLFIPTFPVGGRGVPESTSEVKGVRKLSVRVIF